MLRHLYTSLIKKTKIYRFLCVIRYYGDFVTVLLFLKFSYYKELAHIEVVKYGPIKYNWNMI